MRGDDGHAGPIAAGQHVDEQLRPEQRAAPAQVGPAAFLHVRDADEVPLQALAGVRGQDRDGLDLGRAPGERVAGDLLRGQVLGERGGAGGGQPVGEAGGRVEQRHDRVKITIGGGPGSATLPAGQLPSPRQAAGVPHGPQHLFGAAVGDGQASRVEHGGQSGDGPSHVLGQHGGALRVEQGRREQGRLPHRLGQLTQRAAQPPQVDRVAGCDRAEQQPLRDVLGERRRVEHAPQDVEQHRHRGLFGQRQVRTAYRDRHPGGDHRSAQRAEHGRGRADEYGHPRPRQAFEVGAAQHAGDVGGLLAGRAEDRDLGAAARQFPCCDETPLLGTPGQPFGDPPGGGQQGGAGAARRRQRHDGHVAESRVHVADRRFVGPPEGVDRLVGVADEDQLLGSFGQQREQFCLRRVGVLILVDEDVPTRGPLGGEQGRVVLEHAQRGADQLGGVVAAGISQRRDVLVLAQELAGRDPVGPAPRAAEGTEGRPVQATLDGPHQQVAQLCGEGPGLQRGTQRRGPTLGRVAGHQLPHDDVLLRPGQQPRRGQLVRDGRHPQHAEGIRVQRAGDGLAQRAIQAGGDAVAQFARGPPAERQHQNLLDRHARLHPRHGRLDQRCRLARARPREHQQRPAVVLDHPALRRVEHRRSGGSAVRPDEPVVGSGWAGHGHHPNTPSRQSRAQGRGYSGDQHALSMAVAMLSAC